MNSLLPVWQAICRPRAPSRISDAPAISASMALDYDVLLAGFAPYRYLLGAMGLSLLLLLLLTFRFFRRKISQPIDALPSWPAS